MFPIPILLVQSRFYFDCDDLCFYIFDVIANVTNFRLSNVPFNLHFQSHDWSFTHIWPSFSPPSFSDLLFPPCFFFDFQNQESIPLKALFTIFRLLYCLPKSIQGIPIFSSFRNVLVVGVLM